MFISPILPLPEQDHRILIITNTLVLILLIVIIELFGDNENGKKLMRIFYPAAAIFAILALYALNKQFFTAS